ncbi:MAG: response regulator [Xanthobacteraceae bacterium]|nr:response regulator [Xanthobacteraceae bacterium]
MFDPHTIAIVDDDDAMREALSELLQVFGLKCRVFDRAEAFLLAHGSGSFDCLITDIRMPGIGGLELLRRLRTTGSTMPVIVVTSYADPAVRERAMDYGACAYLTKPLADETLLQSLRSALCEREGRVDGGAQSDG